MGKQSDDRVSRRHHRREQGPRPGGIGWRWLVAMLAALAILTAACSGDSDDSDEAGAEMATDDSDGASFGEAEESEDFEVETDDGDAMTEEEAMEEDAMAESEGDADDDRAADDGSSPLGSGGASVTPTAADLGRQLIFTAFLSVGVDDVPAASAEATAIIEDLGGFLFGQSTEGGSQPRSELTFKILPNDFNRALEQLGTVGELRNQTVTTDDVTERVVDLESRIEVAELGVTRLRAALEQTVGLEDYAEVERLLLNRESELEVMRGQLRTLRDRVDLATITLTLTQERVENAIAVQITAYEGFDEGRSCTGNRELRVEEKTDVTICFEVVNLGDQTLTDIVLTDSVLEIDAETELITVFGDLEELAPGQSALVAFETEVERTIRMRTRVVASPTDGVSPGAAGPAVSNQDNAEVRTFPSDDGPGFGDGFGAAVSVLKGLWTVIIVTIGFLLPLLILLPFLALAWIGLRNLRRRRPTRPAGPSMPPVVPPPPPPAAPAPAATAASTASEAASSAESGSSDDEPPTSGET